jgi:hypothetical protein
MEYNYIQTLLDVYFEGKTTLKEEVLLRDYFESDTVDEAFLSYKPLFSAFSEAASEISTSTIELPQAETSQNYLWLSIAASLVIVVGVAGFMYSNNSYNSQEKEALAALKHSKKAMLMLSQQLNKGTQKLILLDQFQETKKKILKIKIMKKLILLLALIITPLATTAQGTFDSFEDEKDVTSVIVTKNMFKLLSKMDLESDDPEVKDYLNMVDNLNDIKIFTTDNPEVAARMTSKVNSYVKNNKSLSELMRVKNDGRNIKFYSKEGKTESYVSELLMHLDGVVDGESTTVLMSITGNIDLKQIGKLAEDLNVPGSEELKNIKKNK